MPSDLAPFILLLPHTATKKYAGGRSFSYASPYVWNNLPDSLRSTTDYLSFRRQLKTHFFHQAFPT